MAHTRSVEAAGMTAASRPRSSISDLMSVEFEEQYSRQINSQPQSRPRERAAH